MIQYQYFAAYIANMRTDNGVEHFGGTRVASEINFSTSRTQSHCYINDAYYRIAHFSHYCSIHSTSRDAIQQLIFNKQTWILSAIFKWLCKCNKSTRPKTSYLSISTQFKD